MSINPGSPVETDVAAVIDYGVQGEALSAFRNDVELENHNRHPIITLSRVAKAVTVVTIIAAEIRSTQNTVQAQEPNGESGECEIATPINNNRHRSDIYLKDPIKRNGKRSKTNKNESKEGLKIETTEDELLNTYIGINHLDMFTNEPSHTGIFNGKYELMLSVHYGGIWVCKLDNGRYLIKKANIQRDTQHAQIRPYDPFSEVYDLTSGLVGLRAISLTNYGGEKVVLLYTQSPISLNGHNAGIHDYAIWISEDAGNRFKFFQYMGQNDIHQLQQQQWRTTG